mmetsp:Transcript_71220/g.206533  ORF Transcript_71220/g.206533 Transcript_71220/m.206533 type:complete len:344 (-) Transcript_71220:615-1646(-)
MAKRALNAVGALLPVNAMECARLAGTPSMKGGARAGKMLLFNSPSCLINLRTSGAFGISGLDARGACTCLGIHPAIGSAGARSQRRHRAVFPEAWLQDGTTSRGVICAAGAVRDATVANRLPLQAPCCFDDVAVPPGGAALALRCLDMPRLGECGGVDPGTARFAPRGADWARPDLPLHRRRPLEGDVEEGVSHADTVHPMQACLPLLRTCVGLVRRRDHHELGEDRHRGRRDHESAIVLFGLVNLLRVVLWCWLDAICTLRKILEELLRHTPPWLSAKAHVHVGLDVLLQDHGSAKNGAMLGVLRLGDPCGRVILVVPFVALDRCRHDRNRLGRLEPLHPLP